MSTPSSPHSKQTLSILVIGSENVGKTVALSHLLYKNGQFPPEVIARFEKTALTELGGGKKPSPSSPDHHAQFKFAWILEKMQEEKLSFPSSPSSSSSSSNNIQINHFETERYQVNVMDVPGHQHFMRNMVTGTSQADIAILFVSAVPEELKSGFSNDGQTKEHAMLAFTLGIHQLIVVINKMDSMQWSSEAFKFAVQETSSVLKKIGYNLRSIPFIPISGALGENLTTPSAQLDWFKGWKKINKSIEKLGITLVSAIDAIELPKRLPELPLRITIQDVYQIKTGLVPVGRIESGILESGMELQIAPSLAKSIVKSIESGRPEPTLIKAYPGEKTGFLLEGVTLKDIKRGSICSDAKRDPAYVTSAFTASVVAMDRCSKLMKEDKVMVHVHNTRVECIVTELLERIDRRNGQVLEESPKLLKTGEAAVIKLVPLTPLCLEPFSDYPALGRIALRDQGQTLAVGIVKTVEKRDLDGKIIHSSQKK